MARSLLEEQIRISVEGWRTVLEEHPGAFDEAPLERIAKEINRIIFWHGSEKAVLIHGDFHWDNLLMDNQGRIIICDWQEVGTGETIHQIDIPDCYKENFGIVHHEEFTLRIPFTHESWNGRMKACRGIGASLSEKEISIWEQEHRTLLERNVL